jgi:hypothetical protein
MKSSQKDTITFHFKKPEEIGPHHLNQIHQLVLKGGEVGASFVRENLENAFLIGYAVDQKDRVVGTVTHKRPKEVYRRKIERATGLDLSGYLERGYTSVEPEFKDQEIADTLIKGLIERSRGERIYVTIRMDNRFALSLTYKNGMSLAAQYTNWRTGHKIGLFTNQ